MLRIIREILNLDQSPGIYVQTNPPVNSNPVKEGSYLVEVFGWTEPGTLLRVNGDAVDVNEQGMFLYNLNLTREENEVVIEAENDRGNKKIVRSFVVNE